MRVLTLAGIQPCYRNEVLDGLTRTTAAAFIFDPLGFDHATLVRTLCVCMYHAAGRDFWTCSQATQQQAMVVLGMAKVPQQPALPTYDLSRVRPGIDIGTTFHYWRVRDFGCLPWTTLRTFGPLTLNSGYYPPAERFFRRTAAFSALVDQRDGLLPCADAAMQLADDVALSIQQVKHLGEGSL